MKFVPDAIHHTDTSEPLMYIQGWNDCRQAVLSQQALDKMAENAKELGLDYEPAQRTWVGLTDEEVEGYWDWEDFQCGCGRGTLFEMVRDIEAKLKEKNT